MNYVTGYLQFKNTSTKNQQTFLNCDRIPVLINCLKSTSFETKCQILFHIPNLTKYTRETCMQHQIACVAISASIMAKMSKELFATSKSCIVNQDERINYSE